ncbi:hypothetical protein V5F29_05100 [Xanthobacter aminoxidans]
MAALAGSANRSKARARRANVSQSKETGSALREGASRHILCSVSEREGSARARAATGAVLDLHIFRRGDAEPSMKARASGGAIHEHNFRIADAEAFAGMKLDEQHAGSVDRNKKSFNINYLMDSIG